MKTAGVNLGALPLQCETRSLIQALNMAQPEGYEPARELSTWQHVPHRGNPFRDKGGLRGQRQSGSCSKRHHVTREEDFSGRQRVFETLHDCRSIFLNQREYTTHSSLPPFSRRKPPKREQELRDPPPPAPDPPPLSCRSHSQNPVKHGGRL